MDEKLLELFKLADTLNEKQNKVYARITYTADDCRKLEITFISKKDYTYVESIKFQLLRCSMMKFDYIVDLFKAYIGGESNE